MFSTQAHPNHEQILNNKIEMYDEMTLVVGKDMNVGNFSKVPNIIYFFQNNFKPVLKFHLENLKKSGFENTK